MHGWINHVHTSDNILAFVYLHGVKMGFVNMAGNPIQASLSVPQYKEKSTVEF